MTPDEPKHNPRRTVVYPREFEDVTVGLRRLKVPGGWIVISAQGDTFGYVPDPNHTWNLKGRDDEEVGPEEEENVQNDEKIEEGKIQS